MNILHFIGTKCELKQALAKAGVVGHYKVRPDGLKGIRLKTATGAILNWWAGTGAISIQGRNTLELRRRCKRALALIDADRLSRFGLYRA